MTKHAHARARVCVCVCEYIYIHTHTHTHKRAHNKQDKVLEESVSVEFASVTDGISSGGIKDEIGNGRRQVFTIHVRCRDKWSSFFSEAYYLLPHCTPPSPPAADECRIIELYRDFRFSKRC